MQLCEEVADGLAARGHPICVLTSTNREGVEIARSYPVYRLLQIDPDWNSPTSAAWQFFVNRRRREREAVFHLRELVNRFRPNVIFIWHAIGLPRLLLQTAEQMPAVKVVYYLAGYLPELPDEYIAYWQAQPIRPLAKILKRPLARLALGMLAREGKPIPLKYENVICVSEYVRHRLVSQGLIPSTSVVIHNGVDLTHFKLNGSAKLSGDSLRCLIAGRIVPEKGIHTVIDALAKLRPLGNLSSQITLTILGDGPQDYVQRLQTKVCANGLENVVEFRPPVLREQMPQILSEYHALILPSEYGEPIARAMQEAMAMGLLVIGTTTGGSGELLVHEETGLVFEAGNPESLATQLMRTIKEPELARRLAEAGRRQVIAHFDIRQTIDQTERYLGDLLHTTRER